MKIFQIVQKPQLRGAEMFAAQLGNQLLANGHDCRLITIFQGQDELPFNGETIQLNRPLSGRLWDIAGWKMLARIIKREKPDIVQLNAGDTLKFAVLSKLMFGWKAPLVFRNASMPSLYIRGKLVARFNAFLYRYVSAVASVSQMSLQDLNRIFPSTKNKSVVIPVGIDQANIGEKVARFSVPTFIHVGGFTFEKNHRGLLDLFEKIKLLLPAAHLWLVGDGPLRAEIEAIVKDKALDDSVTFYGFVKNSLRYLASADVLLMTSIIEGLPAVILEAMYCKCPVVSFNVGGISEVVKNNQTGFLIQPGKDDEFVERAVQFITDEHLKNRVAIEAFNLVTREFDNRQIALKFVNLYEATTRKVIA